MHPVIRTLATETRLSIQDLVYPIFVCPGQNVQSPIPELPEQYHLSLDCLPKTIDALLDQGIRKILIFSKQTEKTPTGAHSCDTDGLVQKTLTRLSSYGSDLLKIVDNCLCSYTESGHCGILNDSGQILNDRSIQQLAEQALSMAKAGADVIAPSSMLDGIVLAIRSLLDENDFEHIPILGYSAKYHSSFYGPFRHACDSSPQFGDRQSYQMNVANRSEALLEVQADIEEGADFIMVKPAHTYLDILADIKMQFPHHPLFAYHVSGEYSMLMHAIAQKLLPESALIETMIAIKRAGADQIITYAAPHIARLLKET